MPRPSCLAFFRKSPKHDLNLKCQILRPCSEPDQTKTKLKQQTQFELKHAKGIKFLPQTMIF